MGQQIPDTVAINDLDHFVRALTGWHSHKVKVLEHMAEIPSGTEVTFNQGPPVVLEGDLLKGFCMGLNLALMELGKLPFAAEMEEDKEDNSEQAIDDKVIH